MKRLLFLMIIIASYKGYATSIPVCRIVVKVVDHKIEKNCGKNIETLCDNATVYGLRFPIDTKLIYSCDFNDRNKSQDLLSAELSDKMKIENNVIGAKSKLHFASGKLYMIRFGEKQKFRGHTYGVNVTLSLNSINGKPMGISGNPPFQFDEASYNYINFAPNGDLAGFELAQDAQILGFPIKSKEAIYLIDGAYSQIVLSKPHKIGSWSFEGKLSFFKNGKVEMGSLASVHIFDKAKLKGPVRFNEKGDLIMGTLAENVVRVYDPATCGTSFMKAGEAVVGFGEEGARLWPKWYSEDKPNRCAPPSQEMLKKMFPGK